jgi:hypothetical protein
MPALMPLPILPVDEQVVLGPILRAFTEFDIFYQNERLNKLGVIFWYYDPGLSKGKEAEADTFECAVHFKKYPESIIDAHVMAHEIMHLVRYEETNLIQVRLNDLRYYNLAIALQSMLEDPIVDAILQKKYSFNLCHLYLKAINFTQKHSENEPNNSIIRIQEGLVLANSILRWDLIKDKESTRKWVDFMAWFTLKYPNVYRIGSNMASIAKDTGLDTIYEQRKTASKLISEYSLNNILFIK